MTEIECTKLQVKIQWQKKKKIKKNRNFLKANNSRKKKKIDTMEEKQVLSYLNS